MNITIYSRNFDDYEYVANGGNNGKIYLSNGTQGWSFKSIVECLQFIIDNNISLKELTFCYQKNRIQYFKKFNLTNKE